MLLKLGILNYGLRYEEEEEEKEEEEEVILGRRRFREGSLYFHPSSSQLEAERTYVAHPLETARSSNEAG